MASRNVGGSQGLGRQSMMASGSVMKSRQLVSEAGSHHCYFYIHLLFCIWVLGLAVMVALFMGSHCNCCFGQCQVDLGFLSTRHTFTLSWHNYRPI